VHRLGSVLVLASFLPILPAVAQVPSPTSCARSPSADSTVFGLTEVTEPPIVRQLEPPQLPLKLLRQQPPARVVLDFVVNSDGTVDSSSVTVAEPSNTVLDSEAVRVVKRATFSPGCRYENAVRVRVRFPVHSAAPIIIR
jgi:TonB family protein